MELFTPGHLVVILVVVVVLFFGWKQLPDMARSAGRSMRIFRTEVKGISEEMKSTVAEVRDVAPTPPPSYLTPYSAPSVVTREEPDGGQNPTV